MLIGLVGFIGIHGINYQNRIGDIANGIVTDTEHAQSRTLRFIIYDQEQYYETMQWWTALSFRWNRFRSPPRIP